MNLTLADSRTQLAEEGYTVVEGVFTRWHADAPFCA